MIDFPPFPLLLLVILLLTVWLLAPATGGELGDPDAGANDHT